MNTALLAPLPSAAIALIVLVAVPGNAAPSRYPARVKAELDRWNTGAGDETGAATPEERAADA